MIEQVLAVPDSVVYRADNDTWTYRAPIEIKDGDGNVVTTYRPIVSVANVSKNIITAYPAH